MRRFSLWAAMFALLAPLPSFADRMTATLTSGCNETSLTSAVNRGTGFQFETLFGTQLYQGSFDSHGVGSLSYGPIFISSDVERRTERYPLLTVFAGPEQRPGFRLLLHNEWLLWPASNTPDHRTLFVTEASVVARGGYTPTLRVSQKFITTPRGRFASRNVGAEWVWEHSHNFPAEDQTGLSSGPTQEREVRRTRQEKWFFISHGVGNFGIMRFHVGATQRTLARTNRPTTPVSGNIWEIGRLTKSGNRKQTILMLRIDLTIRRWS